jgi:hypothetical protein
LGWSHKKLDFALGSARMIEDETEAIMSEDRFSMFADWVHLAVLNLAKISDNAVDTLPIRLGLEKPHCDEVLLIILIWINWEPRLRLNLALKRLGFQSIRKSKN